MSNVRHSPVEQLDPSVTSAAAAYSAVYEAERAARHNLEAAQLVVSRMASDEEEIVEVELPPEAGISRLSYTAYSVAEIASGAKMSHDNAEHNALEDDGFEYLYDSYAAPEAPKQQSRTKPITTVAVYDKENLPHSMFAHKAEVRSSAYDTDLQIRLIIQAENVVASLRRASSLLYYYKYKHDFYNRWRSSLPVNRQRHLNKQMQGFQAAFNISNDRVSNDWVIENQQQLFKRVYPATAEKLSQHKVVIDHDLKELAVSRSSHSDSCPTDSHTIDEFRHDFLTTFSKLKSMIARLESLNRDYASNTHRVRGLTVYFDSSSNMELSEESYLAFLADAKKMGEPTYNQALRYIDTHVKRLKTIWMGDEVKQLQLKAKHIVDALKKSCNSMSGSLVDLNTQESRYKLNLTNELMAMGETVDQLYNMQYRAEVLCCQELIDRKISSFIVALVDSQTCQSETSDHLIEALQYMPNMLSNLDEHLSRLAVLSQEHFAEYLKRCPDEMESLHKYNKEWEAYHAASIEQWDVDKERNAKNLVESAKLVETKIVARIVAANTIFTNSRHAEEYVNGERYRPLAALDCLEDGLKVLDRDSLLIAARLLVQANCSSQDIKVAVRLYRVAYSLQPDHMLQRSIYMEAERAQSIVFEEPKVGMTFSDRLPQMVWLFDDAALKRELRYLSLSLPISDADVHLWLKGNGDLPMLDRRLNYLTDQLVCLRELHTRFYRLGEFDALLSSKLKDISEYATVAKSLLAAFASALDCLITEISKHDTLVDYARRSKFLLYSSKSITSYQKDYLAAINKKSNLHDEIQVWLKTLLVEKSNFYQQISKLFSESAHLLGEANKEFATVQAEIDAGFRMFCEKYNFQMDTPEQVVAATAATRSWMVKSSGL